MILFELKPTAYFELIHIKAHFLRNLKGFKYVLQPYLSAVYIDDQAEVRVSPSTGTLLACV